jgi:hypothetical protein
VHVDWPTLGSIAVVSAAAALTLVLLVACALVASSGRADEGDVRAGGTTGSRTAAGTAVAALCLLAAGTVVCYALYLIVA